MTKSLFVRTLTFTIDLFTYWMVKLYKKVTSYAHLAKKGFWGRCTLITVGGCSNAYIKFLEGLGGRGRIIDPKIYGLKNV